MLQPAVMIFNRAAGGTQGAHEATGDLLAIAKRLECRTAECGPDHDAAKAAADAVATGAKLIVVAGGDGTIHRVVNGIGTNSHAVIGILPLGTGNDLARSLGLPLEIGAAAEIIERGATRRIDLIRIDGASTQLIVNAANGGFPVKVEQTMTAEGKATLGPLAYLLAAIRAAPDAQRYRARVTIDNAEPFTAETPCLIAANGRYAGGGTPIAPEARLDDGLLDLVIITASTLGEKLSVALDVGQGKHLGSPDVIFRRARLVRIETEPPMPFSIDGEAISGATSIDFEVLPGSLKVIGAGA